MKKKVIFIPKPNAFGNFDVEFIKAGTFSLGTVKPKSFRNKKR